MKLIREELRLRGPLSVVRRNSQYLWTATLGPSVGGEEALQPVVARCDGGLADPRLGDLPVEGVDSARPHVQLGFAAGLPDPAGVGEDFVAQALGGADVEERGRQAGQVGGAGGRSVLRHGRTTLDVAEQRAPTEPAVAAIPELDASHSHGRRAG